jgi:dienelactone hydrolase
MIMNCLRAFFAVHMTVGSWFWFGCAALGQNDWQIPDAASAAHFARHAEQLEAACLTDVDTLSEWQSRRPELRRQLHEMLGLDPLPDRTELHPQVTAITEQDEFTVERLHFQSRPGLYVTGNLYLPRSRRPDERLPTILYLCGHGEVKENGVSYGNKVHYQHHGAWFARNGYACLTIDTLQLGEIEGKHHGTYRYGMWWWLNRGYTPAGVEAWNCIRALDYLETRPEVDPDRFGVTGRSGGGAYSWWIAALDERIKVAVPVAGITDIRNHVLDGCVEGHCDCMFMVNTYRWDYPQVAALVAPRPLLISNTDRDSIFPLDGVVRTHAKVRHIYELYDAGDKLALQITAGPHQDTQELHIHAFRWFNRFLRQDDSPVEKVARPFFTPAELQVFVGGQLPADEQCTSIEESFVPLAAPAAVPRDAGEWAAMKRDWMHDLRTKVFGGWASRFEPLQAELRSETESALREGVAEEVIVFRSDESLLSMPVWRPRNLRQATHVDLVLASELSELSEAGPAAADEVDRGRVLVHLVPRGRSTLVGETVNDQKWTQLQRRYYLLGQSLDGQRVWDVRAAIQALRQIPLTQDAEITLHAQGPMAVIGACAVLFEPAVTRLQLSKLPGDYRAGPYLLNISRLVPLDAVIAMAREHRVLELPDSPAPASACYARQVAEALGW